MKEAEKRNGVSRGFFLESCHDRALDERALQATLPFFTHVILLDRAFAHCPRFPTAAPLLIEKKEGGRGIEIEKNNRGRGIEKKEGGRGIEKKEGGRGKPKKSNKSFCLQVFFI